ncbi:COG3904 family protein [Ruegeria aquimaris]|uniref:Uncharacterized protein n=1 Tax=Ruegeria aquimaris TaxID=2984333 RepID=A0ABT3AQ05_9RHOB|nr:hypothetical protein [Ruegeria sp. XHP0148]MCV2890672.1 hypothetical protein [Ruegeria sp. XHP0148]
MREQHDTKMLEQVINAISQRLETPAREIRAASDRLSQASTARTHEAVAAADASARTALLKAQAHRAFIVLTGVSMLALAIGFAVSLVLDAGAERISRAEPSPVEVAAPAPAPAPTPAPAAVWPNMPEPSGGTGSEEAVVTTNFTLFREKEIKLGTRLFEVIAGHHFNKGTDTQFENAWCYISEFADGMTVRVSLGNKLPSASPQIEAPNASELSKVGISRADHLALFNACPWLDGNPDLAAATPDPSGAAYVFSGEVTAQSVDRLIEAVDNGASRVLFNSPGGSLEDAMRGFSALKDKDIDAVVTGECSSACTLLFLAGQSRSITQEGSVGVHQWRSVGAQTNEGDAQLLSGTLVALMKEAGVSEDFFIAGSSVPPDEILWLSRDQLRDWGVLTS